MEIKIMNSKQIDEEVANIFIQTIQNNPHSVLGKATGSSP